MSIDIGTRNNCIKANIPTLTVFCVINWRQTRKTLIRIYWTMLTWRCWHRLNASKIPLRKRCRELRTEIRTAILFFVHSLFTKETSCLVSKMLFSSTMVLPMIRSPLDRVKGKRNSLIHSAVQPLLSWRDLSKWEVLTPKNVTKYFVIPLSCATELKKPTLTTTCLLCPSLRLIKKLLEKTSVQQILEMVILIKRTSVREAVPNVAKMMC